MVGTFAGRRPQSGAGWGYHHAGPYPSRLDCLHLIDFPDVPARKGDLVWCCRCPGWRFVLWTFRTGNGRKGGVVCGARARRVVRESADPSTRVRLVEVICSIGSAHPGEDHYDESFNFAWPEEARSEDQEARSLPA